MHFLTIVTLSALVSGGSAKWPVIINNGEIKDIYHCIYIFFICTDYVGQWPSNQQSCIEYYRRCADLIKTDEYISPTDNGGGGDSGSSEDDTNGDGDGGSGEGGGGDDGGGGGGDDDGDGDGDSQTDDDGLDTKFARSCKELLKNGTRESGVYKLQLGPDVKDVYCDMNTRGGGWTVIQRRGDFGRPKGYFLRNWTDYREGFGDPSEDVWLGLESIHQLGVGKVQQLLVVLEDFDGNKTALMVNNFTVGNEESGYALSYKNYNSKIGNSLPARGTKFSTVDRDNDAWSKNCAKRFSGAWWYSACHNSNLNGLYLKGEHESFGNGVNWYHWKGYHYSLKHTEMKIRAKRSSTSSSATSSTTSPSTSSTTSSSTS